MNPVSTFFLWKRHGYVRKKMGGVHSKILDVGCGLHKVRLDEIGMDTKSWKRPDVVGSALGLPFAGGSFDCVTMLELIEHMNKGSQQMALQEAKRVLKPSGLFIMSTPNMSKWWSAPYKLIWAIWEKTVQREYRHEHIGMFPQRYIERLLVHYFDFLGSQRVALLDRVYLCRKANNSVEA